MSRFHVERCGRYSLRPSRTAHDPPRLNCNNIVDAIIGTERNASVSVIVASQRGALFFDRRTRPPFPSARSCRSDPKPSRARLCRATSTRPSPLRLAAEKSSWVSGKGDLGQRPFRFTSIAASTSAAKSSSIVAVESFGISAGISAMVRRAVPPALALQLAGAQIPQSHSIPCRTFSSAAAKLPAISASVMWTCTGIESLICFAPARHTHVRKSYFQPASR